MNIIDNYSAALDASCNADYRTTVAAIIGNDNLANPPIETIIESFQRHYYPNPAYALVDPFDLYLWRAFADSERQMIDLIESRRPQKAVSA